MSFEKTEQATKRRREKARRQGQVARTRELPGALAVLAAVFLLSANPLEWVGRWKAFLQQGLDTAVHSDISMGSSLLGSTGLLVLQLAGPVLLLVWIVATLSLAGQGGFVFAPAALQPRWERISPAANLKKLFSLSGWSRLLRSFVPVAALAWLLADILVREWVPLAAATRIRPGASAPILLGLLFEMAWKGGLVLLLWAGVDYALQYWNYERSLRMTKREVRDERKETEGNPETRSRLRRVQRRLRQGRLGLSVRA